jgi:hypothetical protein
MRRGGRRSMRRGGRRSMRRGEEEDQRQEDQQQEQGRRTGVVEQTRQSTVTSIRTIC